MATSAAEKLFAIPELLEHILLSGFGDSSDVNHTVGLYALRRVSKAFLNITTTSKKLQRVMFLCRSSDGEKEHLPSPNPFIPGPGSGDARSDTTYPFVLENVSGAIQGLGELWFSGRMMERPDDVQEILAAGAMPLQGVGSWREMLVLRDHKNVVPRVLMQWLDWDDETVYRTRRFSEGATLGEVADWLILELGEFIARRTELS